MFKKIASFTGRETKLSKFIKANKRITFPLMVLIMFAGLLTFANQYQISGVQTKAAPQSLSIAVIVLGNSTDYTNAQRQLLTDPKSLKNFYETSSYGNMAITGQVFGPFSYTSSPGETCHTLASNARSLAGSAGSDFDRVIIFSPNASCIRQGTVITPSGIVIAAGYNIQNTGAHEIGHTIGLGHAGAYKPGCVKTENNIQTLTSNCIVDYQYSYFDGADVMGTQQRLFHNRNKSLLGWLEPTPISSTGTYTLTASSQASGDRMLVLGNSGLYLELRTNTGFDAGLSNTDVYIRRPCSQSGTEVTSCKITTLAPGSTFYDPFKQVWIKNINVTGTTAQVYVGFGANASPGPGGIDGGNGDSDEESTPTASFTSPRTTTGTVTYATTTANFLLYWKCEGLTTNGTAQLKTGSGSYESVNPSGGSFESVSQDTTYTLRCTNGTRMSEKTITIDVTGTNGESSGTDEDGGNESNTELLGKIKTNGIPSGSYTSGPLTASRSNQSLLLKWTCPQYVSGKQVNRIRIVSESGNLIQESTSLTGETTKPFSNTGNRSYSLRCLRLKSDGTFERLSGAGPLLVTVNP